MWSNHEYFFKQRLNTKCSAEIEVVGTINYVTLSIYAQTFLEAQGYNMKPAIMY